jgi:hypothetical protein
MFLAALDGGAAGDGGNSKFQTPKSTVPDQEFDGKRLVEVVEMTRSQLMFGI